MADSQFPGEPDYEEFEHAGLKCRILRHTSMKHLCGYVGVPQNHPLYGKDGKDFMDVDFRRLDAHGSITFAGKGNEGMWWIGFDCARAGDLIPGHKLDLFDEVYRDITYVREQTKRLADQLRSLSSDAG